MDLAAAALGFLTGAFGLALAFITLWTKVRNGIKSTVLEVLVESGLAKQGKKEQVWPNGSDTLPDFLNNLYGHVMEIRDGQAGQTRRTRRRWDDPDGAPI